MFGLHRFNQTTKPVPTLEYNPFSNYTFARNPIHSSVGDYSFENGTVMWLSYNFATNIRRK